MIEANQSKEVTKDFASPEAMKKREIVSPTHANPVNCAPPQSTPSKPVKAQKVVPVVVQHAEAEDEEVKDSADKEIKLIDRKK